MTDLSLFLSVLVASALPMLEVWLAVPAGIIAGLAFIPAVIAGFIGNSLTVLPLIIGGDKFRAWLASKRKKPSKSAEKISSPRTKWIIEKFGVPGLAFIGPFLIGSHIAALAAVALGVSRTVITIWFLASLAICSVIFGALAVLGVTSFIQPATLPGL